MSTAAPSIARVVTRQRRIDSLDITVLAGGPGDERAVSLASGKAIHKALVRLGHKAVLHDVHPRDLSALDIPTDFVFIALHGEFGEDGTLQAELDARSLPYSGCGAEASRIAMDKDRTKRICIEAGIPTPPYAIIDKCTPGAPPIAFDLPVVVKPVSSGSSVDTTIVRTESDLAADVEAVVKKYGRALVERYVSGPELTVGILGTEALPVCEIRTKREFYDYQAKYIDDDTEYILDPPLPDALTSSVQELSLAAHRALGCRAFSRVDWMVDAETSQPFLLEINTIPGFTSHSLLPKTAARAGIEFDQLCQRIVELSLQEPA